MDCQGTRQRSDAVLRTAMPGNDGSGTIQKHKELRKPYYPAALFGATFGFSASSLGALVANCSSCGIDGTLPLILA